MRNLVKVTRNPNNWYQSQLFFCSGKIYPLFPTVTCDHRRLLISSNWWANTSFEVSGPLVRSLVVTGRRSDFPRPHVSSLYHNFKLLRVLDLGSVNVGNDFPVGLEKMTLLKRLTLSGFRLPWDHISVIGRQLVNLEALKLHNNAFHGSSWEVKGEEFPRLKLLKLDTLLSLEQWSIFDNALPCLERLELHKCKKLKELHRNLGGCTKLMEIEVKWCSQFLQASAMTVKERHIEELKNRKRAQEYFWNKRNMKIGKFLGTGMDTQETSPSVLLCFDKERFIFNAGEVCRFAIAITKTKVLRVLGNPNDTSIVYICKLHDITGKVDKDKAKACGLNPGRKLGQLQKGFSVKSDLLYIEVHPDDVIGPTIPGPIVLIVDCPTEPHAQELLSAQALEAYYSDSQSNSPETAKVVSCIIHLSPATVINSPVYEKWMRKFDSAQHIMARIPRKHKTTPILVSSAKIGTRLQYLCPQLFPAPSLPSVGDDVAAPHIKGSACGLSAENLLKSSAQNLMTSSVFIEELRSEIPEIADAAKNISKFWHKPKEDEVELSNRQDSSAVATEEPSKFCVPRCLENLQRDDLEIVFLGTGSSVPSKYRNVSSIHVNLFSKGVLLLDCGEGTLAQLKRRYGIIGADSAVRNLKCIWISHIHADHHAGLSRMLALRRDLLKGVAHEPILVIGPEQIGEFLKEYIKLEDLDMLFLDCKSTTGSKWDDMEAEDSFLLHCSKKYEAKHSS
ncbi:cox19 family protein [Capsicum annuum]|nr:cox19 family protein [Capsicum annuum]